MAGGGGDAGQGRRVRLAVTLGGEGPRMDGLTELEEECGRVATVALSTTNC